MTTTDATPVLHVPARDIPVPAHLSNVAQSVLAMAPMEQRKLPDLDDREGWRTTIAARDEAVLSMIAEQASRVVAVPRVGTRARVVSGEPRTFHAITG